MADIIQLLPDHVANQIAAGEVVQRPASVVKELLENAIDAKATTIKLIVKEAGKTLIQVIDNGIGMSATDARLSFERHATSKIREAEDLFKLNTKGFRGEALASISAIAHVELKTKQGQEEIGTELIIEGSEVISQNVTVTPKGTSIAVKNLFFNIPARRNFLKSNTVEMRHIIDEFHRVALSHIDINFEFFNNGSELFNLPKSNFRQRIVNVFGQKQNEKLVPINEETEILKLSGFVGKPEFAKRTRGEQFFFVNNRFIKSGYLNHAVSSAFEGLLKDGAHPSYYLNLEVDPKTIDINIHPTKTEIKFDDEHSLYAILRSSIKHGLGQFNIAPVLDFEQNTNLNTPYNYKDKDASFPKVEVDKHYNPFTEEEPKKEFSSVSYNKFTNSSWDSLYVGLNSENVETENPDFKFEQEEETKQLFDDSKNQNVSNSFQLKQKYIVSTIKSGVVVIDQNRAHQRILYENFLQSITIEEATSQQLLFPLQYNFSKAEIETLNLLKTDLEQTGFVFKKTDKESVEILGIPTQVQESQIQLVLEQLITDSQNEVPETSFSTSDLLAKSMAKSLAIKTGQTLNNEEQNYILNKLFACKEPLLSPENKSTFITLSVEELTKKFN